MNTTIILAAGKQSRFKSKKPKCLLQYNNKLTILEKNIQVMCNYSDNILVVLDSKTNNVEVETILNNISKKHHGGYIIPVYIESGKGTGHAVYKVLQQLKKTVGNRNIYLIWGDSIQDNTTIIEKTIQEYNGKCTVPLKWESASYMNFMLTYNNFIIKAWQPPTNSGYHDFSFFMFDLDYMYVLLDLYHKKYIKDKPINKSYYNTLSGEMNFIDLFNQFGLSKFAHATIINDPDISSVNAFNTMTEYKKIIKGRLK